MGEELSGQELVSRAAGMAAGKLIFLVGGSIFLLMAGLIGASGKLVLDSVHAKIDASALQAKEQRISDINALNLRLNDLGERLSGYINNQQQLQDEQKDRATRIATLEAESRHLLRTVGEIGPRLEKIATDVATIKAEIGHNEHRPKANDGAALPPEKKPDVAVRVPMLHY